MHVMSPEYQTLTGCINASFGRCTEGGLPPFAPILPILDWDRMLELSAWHGVDKASDSNSPSKQRILKEIVDMYAAWNRRTPEAGKEKLVAKWKAIESQP